MARRLATISILALVAGVGAVPALAGAKPRHTAAAWTSSVKVATCSPETGEAVFHGKMRRLPQTKRMAMRFVLLERTGLDGFLDVAAPKLGRWRKSRPGVRQFGYRQVIRGLDDGAVYKVRVDYRWLGEDGDVIAKARKRSASCPDQGALPNLRIRVNGVRRTSDANTDRYFLRVTNLGKAPAESVVARLSADGLVTGSATVQAIAPGAWRNLVVRGAECGRWVQAQVDPDAAIAETDEQDNTHQLACQDLKPR
jgi:hypothetical protein